MALIAGEASGARNRSNVTSATQRPTTIDEMTLAAAADALDGDVVATMTMNTSTVRSTGTTARQLSAVPGRASHQSTANTYGSKR